MPTTHPADRFDQLPDDLSRVGAHRAEPRRGRGWISFAWAALATGVLVGAGALGLNLISNSVGGDLPFAFTPGESEAPVESSAPVVEPSLNPTIPITILNGTLTDRLATTVGDQLVLDGWGGAAIDIGLRGNASEQDIPTTTVYYSDPANEAAALALVQSLGVGTTVMDDSYPESPLTVVLGADYTAPVG